MLSTELNRNYGLKVSISMGIFVAFILLFFNEVISEFGFAWLFFFFLLIFVIVLRNTL